MNGNEQNSVLKSYVNYYKKCDSPGYAVLVTGEWGAGKTFQVKEALSESEYYYVSLYGVQSADEIVSSVFAKMYPMRSFVKTGFKRLGEASIDLGQGSIGVGGLASGIANALIRDKVKNDRVIIFDDLERCGVSLNEIMGVINRYVEHCGCRVLVISHDDKIVDKSFHETKEKVFGHVVRVLPAVNEALDLFVSSADSEVRPLLLKYREIIVSVFISSQAGSLRVLRCVISELERLYLILSSSHKENKEAIIDLTKVFCAWSIEVKMGRVMREDVFSRRDALVQNFVQRSLSPDEHQKSPCVIAHERYCDADVNIASPVLRDELLSSMLFDGLYEEAKLHESIENSVYFMKTETEQPWKVMMNFEKLDDGVVSEAVENLNRQFDQRDADEPGIILHIFAFRFLMARSGLLNKTNEEVVAECKLYLDDLRGVGGLPSFDTYSQWGFRIFESYDGYGYWVEEGYKSYFEEVFSYMIESSRLVLENKCSTYADELLELVRSDGERFAMRIKGGSDCDGDLSKVDVLSSINYIEFVDAWLSSPPQHWSKVRSALDARYASGELTGELSGEAQWVANMIRKLEQEKDKVVGMQRIRMERIIPGKIKDQAERALAGLAPEG